MALIGPTNLVTSHVVKSLTEVSSKCVCIWLARSFTGIYMGLYFHNLNDHLTNEGAGRIVAWLSEFKWCFKLDIVYPFIMYPWCTIVILIRRKSRIQICMFLARLWYQRWQCRTSAPATVISTWMNNYIPHNIVKCNYISMPWGTMLLNTWSNVPL